MFWDMCYETVTHSFWNTSHSHIILIQTLLNILYFHINLNSSRHNPLTLFLIILLLFYHYFFRSKIISEKSKTFKIIYIYIYIYNIIYNFKLTNDNFFNILIFLNHFHSKFTFYKRKIWLRVNLSEFWRLKNISKTNQSHTIMF